ncbi:MAG TPA: substrate-binding domain-containing protein [Pirellulales bacterium]|nr:substrate-binding domain-containing protein [Pirellulales bacterium]
MCKRLPWAMMLALTALLGCTKSPADSGKGNAADSSGTSTTSSAASTGDSGGKKFRIAVIPKGTGHQFWKSVEAGARKAASETGAEITFKGPTGEGDTTGQIQIVENFLADGYDAICLAPLDAVALRKPVDEAIKNNVPVIVFDSELKDMTGITSFVATNNYHAGQRAGEYLTELLGGKGRVILMRYNINSASTEAREQGFLDALAKSKGIELLSSDKHGGPGEADSVKLGEDFLLNFGEKIDGIFCPNESTASGMLTALKKDSRGLAGKIKFVGFDSSDNLVGGLKDGHLNAVVLQDPVQMGHDAVQTAVQKLRGEKVPEKIEVPEALATTKNLSDPKIDSLLHPAKAD